MVREYAVKLDAADQQDDYEEADREQLSVTNFTMRRQPVTEVKPEVNSP